MLCVNVDFTVCCCVLITADVEKSGLAPSLHPCVAVGVGSGASLAGEATKAFGFQGSPLKDLDQANVSPLKDFGPPKTSPLKDFDPARDEDQGEQQG